MARYTYATGYIDAVAVPERDLNGDDDFADDDEVVYYHSNTLYSVYALSDADENVVERMRYDAYGAATVLDADFSDDTDGASDVENSYTFTARRWDVESSLMQYRNRYYDPALGRFISRDPLDHASTTNAFAYVDNIPVTSLDPLGLMPIWYPSHQTGSLTGTGGPAPSDYPDWTPPLPPSSHYHTINGSVKFHTAYNGRPIDIKPNRTINYTIRLEAYCDETGTEVQFGNYEFDYYRPGILPAGASLFGLHVGYQALLDVSFDIDKDCPEGQCGEVLYADFEVAVYWNTTFQIDWSGGSFEDVNVPVGSHYKARDYNSFTFACCVAADSDE